MHDLPLKKYNQNVGDDNNMTRLVSQVSNMSIELFSYKDNLKTYKILKTNWLTVAHCTKKIHTLCTGHTNTHTFTHRVLRSQLNGRLTIYHEAYMRLISC